MEKIKELYQSLGDSTITDLYMYSCLITSGFNEEKATKLLSLLRGIWIKDENSRDISTLSDNLYEAYENDKNIGELSPREILDLEEFVIWKSF